MQFRGLQPKKLKVRADLREDLLREQLFSKGLKLRWEQAAPCPCGRKIEVDNVFGFTGEVPANCTECGGRGVIWHSPQEIQAVVIGAQQDPDRFSIYGAIAKGMVGISTLPEQMPGWLDRYVVLDHVMVWSEKKQRREAVEKPRVPIVVRDIVVGSAADPTEPETIQVGVPYCRKSDADGVIVAGELVEGTHFTVTAGGAIDWSIGEGSGAPAVGEFYALTYYGHPQYLVYSFPHVSRATYVRLKSTVPQLKELPTKADCLLEFWGDNIG